MKFFKHGGVGELRGAAVVVNPQSRLFGFSLSFINVRLNCYICINHKRDLDSRQQNPLSFHPSLPPSIIYLFISPYHSASVYWKKRSTSNAF